MVRRSRTPQGVRGLKPADAVQMPDAVLSHSARSAWIETAIQSSVMAVGASRTPQGVRGLKPKEAKELLNRYGRTPQGVRGLKRNPHLFPRLRRRSHSARSAWIETRHGGRNGQLRLSHSARSAWIETKIRVGHRADGLSRTPQGVRGLKLMNCKRKRIFFESHSARSAWIETK